MKTCTKCGETKPFMEFSKDRTKKDGHRSQCKSCRKQYREQNKEVVRERERRYREKNKEAFAERQRRYEKENKEAILERKRRWREKNKEAAREYNRLYYQKNRETEIERQRRYQKENKEAILERERRRYQENREVILERDRRARKKRRDEQPGCVYRIVNSVNRRVYVGETMRGELRWIEHLRCLRGNRHQNQHLQADFDEFGEDVFEWSIIQELPKDKEVLVQEETNTIQRLLAEGKELYNIILN